MQMKKAELSRPTALFTLSKCIVCTILSRVGAVINMIRKRFWINNFDSDCFDVWEYSHPIVYLFYCLNGTRLVHSSITHLYNTSSLILM